MALSREDSIQKYGTAAYTGWDEIAAEYDARAYPEKLNTETGNGGLPSASEVANAVIAAVTESLPEVPKYSDNPFAFDEALAREASTAEFSPFYQEKLDDFITDIETTRQRGGAEEKKLLQDLTTERDVGLAERGLTFSGEKRRDLTGEVNATTASPVGFVRDLQRQGRDITTTTRNLFEDLTKQAFRGTRDVNREKGTAIEQGVLQRRGEALDSYLSGIKTQEEGLFQAQPLGVLGSIVP